MKLVIKKLHEISKDEDIPKTAEERLDLVEHLRIQSGKFLYEYPARFQRVFKITRKK